MENLQIVFSFYVSCILRSTEEEAGIAPRIAKIHSTLNDSRSLDRVAVRDNGRKSLLMSCTG